MNLGITPLMKKQYQQLSTGQKRRLHLAIAMLASPDILFLDEPTAGLDVEGRASLHQVIRKLKQQGKTIVLASHDMSEVETLCDRIALIKDGSILYEGAVDTFTRNDKHHVLLHLETSGKLDASMVKHCRFVQQDLHQCTFESDQLTLALGELVELVNVQQLEVLDIRVEHASLEQRFLQTIQEDAA